MPGVAGPYYPSWPYGPYYPPYNPQPIYPQVQPWQPYPGDIYIGDPPPGTGPIVTCSTTYVN